MLLNLNVQSRAKRSVFLEKAVFTVGKVDTYS